MKCRRWALEEEEIYPSRKRSSKPGIVLFESPRSLKSPNCEIEVIDSSAAIVFGVVVRERLRVLTKEGLNFKLCLNRRKDIAW
jgi:hypothetical protein